jgi:hypothetical protein
MTATPHQWHGACHSGGVEKHFVGAGRVSGSAGHEGGDMKQVSRYTESVREVSDDGRCRHRDGGLRGASVRITPAAAGTRSCLR